MKIPRGQTPERKAYMKAWQAANPRDRRAYKAEYDRKNSLTAVEFFASRRFKLVKKSAPTSA